MPQTTPPSRPRRAPRKPVHPKMKAAAGGAAFGAALAQVVVEGVDTWLYPGPAQPSLAVVALITSGVTAAVSLAAGYVRRATARWE